MNVCSCENGVTVDGNGTVTLVGGCDSDCNCAEIVVSNDDTQYGQVWVYYQCCDGAIDNYEIYASPGTYTLCNRFIFSLVLFDGSGYNPVSNSTYISINSGSSSCNCEPCGTTCS